VAGTEGQAGPRLRGTDGEREREREREREICMETHHSWPVMQMRKEVQSWQRTIVVKCIVVEEMKPVRAFVPCHEQYNAQSTSNYEHSSKKFVWDTFIMF
jgi:hypothetical protein